LHPVTTAVQTEIPVPEITDMGSTVQIFATTITNQYLIQEEIKRRLNSGNACYHSSHLLSKNVKIRICSQKTIILAVVLYGYKTWFVTLREEHMLNVFQNRVLR
jgi:hypothetical protein